jgi:hypothetical protein
MLYGVSEEGVHATNPLGVIPLSEFAVQVCVPSSVVLVDAYHVRNVRWYVS